MEFEYSYRFTEKAVRDFDDILHYISLDNTIAAQKLGNKIFEKIDLVRLFPESGELLDNEFLSDKSVRKLLVYNHIVYYKVDYDQKIIYVVRIVYGKRNLEEILKDMD